MSRAIGAWAVVVGLAGGCQLVSGVDDVEYGSGGAASSTTTGSNSSSVDTTASTTDSSTTGTQTTASSTSSGPPECALYTCDGDLPEACKALKCASGCLCPNMGKCVSTADITQIYCAAKCETAGGTGECSGNATCCECALKTSDDNYCSVGGDSNECDLACIDTG